MAGQFARYNDVSHFRAPYKNAVFSGFGAVATPAGPVLAAPPALPGAAELIQTVTTMGAIRTTDKGALEFVPSVAAALIASLEGFLAISEKGKPDTAFLQPIDPSMINDPATQKLNAGNWVKTKLADGKTVLGTLSVALPVAVTKGLAAIDPDSEVQGTKGTGFAVLARPTIGTFAAIGKALMSPVGIAGMVLVGAAVFFVGKKKRS